MKRFLLYISIFIILIYTFSCKKYDTFGREIKSFDEIEKASWILGNWENKSDTTLLSETWEQLNDSTFISTTFYIQDKKDTLHYEVISLVEDEKGILIYDANVKGENNDEPVSFQKLIDNDSLLQFENPKNDYPKKIIYKKLPSNKMEISISGLENGKNSTSKYVLNKAN